MFWLGLIVGMFIGGSVGAVIMAAVAMAKRADEQGPAKNNFDRIEPANDRHFLNVR
jgi:cysteine synthase